MGFLDWFGFDLVFACFVEFLWFSFFSEVTLHRNKEIKKL